MSEAHIERDGAFHFRVVGEMTFSTAKQLLAQSEAYFNSAQDMEIDLSRVTAADSAGLALLLEWKAMVAEKGFQAALADVPESIRSIAHLCQIDALLENSQAE